MRHSPKFGATILHYAARANNVALIRLCLARGADPRARTEVGETPLHWLTLHAASIFAHPLSSSSLFHPLSPEQVETIHTAALYLVHAGASLFASCAIGVRPCDLLPAPIRQRILRHSSLRDRCLASIAARLADAQSAQAQQLRQRLTATPSPVDLATLESLKLSAPHRPKWWRGPGASAPAAHLPAAPLAAPAAALK